MLGLPCASLIAGSTPLRNTCSPVDAVFCGTQPKARRGRSGLKGDTELTGSRRAVLRQKGRWAADRHAATLFRYVVEKNSGRTWARTKDPLIKSP
jgi:hypothetical protein